LTELSGEGIVEFAFPRRVGELTEGRCVEAPEFAISGRVGKSNKGCCVEATESVVAGQDGFGRGDIAELTVWPCEGARTLGIPRRVGNGRCGVLELLEGLCAEVSGFAVVGRVDARRVDVPGRDGVLE
jgi:hypothetical protein